MCWGTFRLTQSVCLQLITTRSCANKCSEWRVGAFRDGGDESALKWDQAPVRNTASGSGEKTFSLVNNGQEDCLECSVSAFWLPALLHTRIYIHMSTGAC